MCGIVLARDIETAERMLEILEHRGRDDRKICGARGWAVGHNRLAIVDRGPEGEQPFANAKGTVTAFNGEIYNYGEIYEALEKKPRERSEVQVLDALMQEHQEFDRVLDGYYAIIRVEEDRIILARDLFGVMPLYMAFDEGWFLEAVASEKKALVGFDHVEEVGAGQTVWFKEREGGWELCGRKWFDPFSLHLEDVDLHHVEFLFKRAVRRRALHADVPVTISLSGGLDSALVAWAVAQNRIQNVDAVTVGVDEMSDEVQNARLLAKLAGIAWKFVQVTDQMVAEHRDRILYHLEDERVNPIKWRGMVRNYFVAQNAKGTVILCGEGADEIGAGYPSHERAGTGLALEWKALSTIRSMPAINLDRVNKGGMAWTKEFRTPFLDRALVLYLMGCRKQPRKEIFRKLAEKIGLPLFVLVKAKYGEEEKRLEKLADVR